MAVKIDRINIEIAGIVRDVSPAEAPLGSCQELVNLRIWDGALRPIKLKRLLFNAIAGDFIPQEPQEVPFPDPEPGTDPEPVTDPEPEPDNDLFNIYNESGEGANNNMFLNLSDFYSGIVRMVKSQGADWYISGINYGDVYDWFNAEYYDIPTAAWHQLQLGPANKYPHGTLIRITSYVEIPGERNSFIIFKLIDDSTATLFINWMNQQQT